MRLVHQAQRDVDYCTEYTRRPHLPMLQTMCGVESMSTQFTRYTRNARTLYLWEITSADATSSNLLSHNTS